MKPHYTLFILLSLLFSISSCRKDKLEKSLIGSWEIREETGGGLSVGPPHGPYAAGNGRIIQFTENTYSYIEGKNILYSGSYTVDVKRSNGKTENILNFEKSAWLFRIKDNRLTIYPPPRLQDASTIIYERVKDPVLTTN